MKNSTQLAPNALTELRERSTPEQNICTKTWATWLGLQTFDDPQIVDMVHACARFSRALKNKEHGRWLSLIGTRGTGKTHCAECIWDWAVPRFNWYRCESIHGKIYWPRFVEELRAQLAYDQYRDMMDWPILFLDDIGAEKDGSGFSSDKLNTLIGTRVGKWTLITSNLMLDGIASIDPRISDRMAREPGNQCIEVNTTSFAFRKDNCRA